MVSYIRNAVALAGFGGAYVLLLALPFLSPEWRLFGLVFTFLLMVVTLLLVLVLNKLLLGVYRPGPRLTPDQIDAIRQAARKRRPTDFLLAVPSLVVSLPIVFLMKKFGWSQNSTLAVGLIVSAVLGLLFTIACVKYGQKRS
jgi:hypothetical protein